MVDVEESGKEEEDLAKEEEEEELKAQAHLKKRRKRKYSEVLIITISEFISSCGVQIYNHSMSVCFLECSPRPWPPRSNLSGYG